MNTELRKECPMRHKNGNCMPAGGFCTAVNNPICEALHNAYDTGRRAADVVEVKHAHYEVVPNQHKNQAVPDVRCSNCQRVLKRKKENYCPHCGAKMDGEHNEK